MSLEWLVVCESTATDLTVESFDELFESIETLVTPSIFDAEVTPILTTLACDVFLLVVVKSVATFPTMLERSIFITGVVAPQSAEKLNVFAIVAGALEGQEPAVVVVGSAADKLL
ncbi:hypothetical protein GQX74_013875 [Glossina fuscipes]|nr:hypothetical protein GQX74_013875 [Glossina fuscipes]